MWLAVLGLGLVALALRGLGSERQRSQSPSLVFYRQAPDTSSSWSL
jgi:hypothetical protein